MKKYFYTDGVNKFGPFSKDELKSQKITRNTKVWHYGLERWLEISESEELVDIISTIPPGLKTLNSQSESQIQKPNQTPKSEPIQVQPDLKKSKLVRGLIGLLTFVVISFSIFKLLYF